MYLNFLKVTDPTEKSRGMGGVPWGGEFSHAALTIFLLYLHHM